ncbi:MAG: MBL fold metallo-hydrolase [Candidatus Baldrarchaeia archaeon]
MKDKVKYLKVLLIIIITVFTSYVSFIVYDIWISGKESPKTPETLNIGIAEHVRIIVLYDNYPFDERLKTAWGFSCLINVSGIIILFDTGGDPETLLYNMDMLNISVEEIQIIVLSHIHGDHVGGLTGVLSLNNHVRVYVPSSFPSSLKNEIGSYGCELVEIKNATTICEGVATTGELGTTIKEQSLLTNTSRGLVIVTGCAHPGVVKIVEEAEQLTNTNVYLLIGGFHLIGASEKEISSIIEQLKDLDVEMVAPCHCSGDLARSMFKEAFGENYIDVGVGKTIEI